MIKVKRLSLEEIIDLEWLAILVDQVLEYNNYTVPLEEKHLKMIQLAINGSLDLETIASYVVDYLSPEAINFSFQYAESTALSEEEAG
ncbi:hypothetical protein [Desulforamulus hydrothermalis]|uniref:Uncharacterized protein n=1 Tax=Desulforamulus hydrothermalis Lam5 = DSM 18033 TaxID=1121428 RepID=K8E126_9FIRM|nr:hypothetical protein [Desulforamulus hydrothermalis]CCO09397.1 conserved hypothetical protein [Desulforamulus hydrothermalis Lam5 = DSM 18033]SHH08999.1 hypothetical protein SAMN02745177_01408 [Desulforamulus hydrothermalis Lam5 = DSM 18033]